MKPATTGQSARDSGLGWFVVLAFALLWMVMVPAALAAHGIVHLRVPRALQTVAEFAPTIAALIITASISGRQGLKALLGGILRARFSSRWYAFALLVPLATQWTAFEVYRFVNQATPGINEWYEWPVIVAFYLPICLGQEEIGWRGFFLDRLIQRSSLWVAALCMAGVWGLWHLPTYLARSNGQLYLLFLAGIIPTSAWLTFIYSRTRSLLLCGILHASLNAGLPNWLAPLPVEDARFAFGIWIGLLWLATIPVFVALGKPTKDILRVEK
jgi:uncharacterized protein